MNRGGSTIVIYRVRICTQRPNKENNGFGDRPLLGSLKSYTKITGTSHHNLQYLTAPVNHLESPNKVRTASFIFVDSPPSTSHIPPLFETSSSGCFNAGRSYDSYQPRSEFARTTTILRVLFESYSNPKIVIVLSPHLLRLLHAAQLTSAID